MAFRSSKKNEIGTPFGVGTVYKTSGFVDIVELRISELRRLKHFIMNLMNQPRHLFSCLQLETPTDTKCKDRRSYLIGLAEPKNKYHYTLLAGPIYRIEKIEKFADCCDDIYLWPCKMFFIKQLIYQNSPIIKVVTSASDTQ